MPQMAPYNWMNLLFMFSLILMYLIIYIYFITKHIYMTPKFMKKKFIWNW